MGEEPSDHAGHDLGQGAGHGRHGDRRPVVLVQTARREIGHAALLARRLGRDVVELPAPRMSETTMLTRVADWVAVHREGLARSGVEPPHLLLGWSFGGVVALEIARQLHEEGTPPGHVGLLDSIRPRIRPIRLRDAVPYHLTEAAYLPDPDERRRYLTREAKIRVGRRVRRERAALARRAAALRGRETAYAGKPTDPNVRSIHRSYLNHVVEPVDVPVTLYTTRGSVRRCNGDPSLRWAPFLRGGFTLVPVPGGHYDMWEEPHLDVVASRVAAGLDAVIDRGLEREPAAGSTTGSGKMGQPELTQF